MKNNHTTKTLSIKTEITNVILVGLDELTRPIGNVRSEHSPDPALVAVQFAHHVFMKEIMDPVHARVTCGPLHH